LLIKPVTVIRGYKRSNDLKDPQTAFLGNLPDGCMGNGFPGIDLPFGKIPLPPAFHDQVFAFLIADQSARCFHNLKTGFEPFAEFIQVMMEDKKRINPFQFPVKINELLQIIYIPVFIKQSVSQLKIPDEIVSQKHNPVVEKNFVHLQHE
jgi:hypothetical protein